MPSFITPYLCIPMESPQSLIDDSKPFLENLDFDTMIGTGLSGTIATIILANHYKKKYSIVRKNTDTSNHGWHKVEGIIGKKWIFIDDLIDTGSTFYYVRAEMKNIEDLYYADPDTRIEYIGRYLYHNYGKPRFDDATQS